MTTSRWRVRFYRGYVRTIQVVGGFAGRQLIVGSRLLMKPYMVWMQSVPSTCEERFQKTEDGCNSIQLQKIVAVLNAFKVCHSIIKILCQLVLRGFHTGSILALEMLLQKAEQPDHFLPSAECRKSGPQASWVNSVGRCHFGNESNGSLVRVKNMQGPIANAELGMPVRCSRHDALPVHRDRHCLNLILFQKITDAQSLLREW